MKQSIVPRKMIKPLYLLTLVLAILFILSSCRKSLDAGAGADPGDLLPANNDISGFTRKGSPAIMTDYQTVMDAIDGAAEKYIDYGFVEGVQQLFTNGSLDIDVHILNHGTDRNARGIFLELYPASPEVIATGSPEIVIDHSLLTGYTIKYVRGNMYLEINTYEKSTFALNMAKQFIWNIDKKIAT